MDRARVFEFLQSKIAGGQATVLVTVCAVEGSSMRNPGTHMGVAEDGTFEGSLSGGCIENAVVAEALDTLKLGASRIVRFGVGSPYLDIKLPCGGGLDIHFQPLRNAGFIDQCIAAMRSRQPFAVRLSEDGVLWLKGYQAAAFNADTGTACFGHWPEPRLLIIGHGAGVPALASLAQTNGYRVAALTPDPRVLGQLQDAGTEVELIEQTSDVHLLTSDPWTAIVFLFHDHDWEIELIQRALDLPHFYLGAMGGRRAHDFRSQALLAAGAIETAIAAIHAPIGLFHSSRDPQTLALSALAEITRVYQSTDFERADA